VELALLSESRAGRCPPDLSSEESEVLPSARRGGVFHQMGPFSLTRTRNLEFSFPQRTPLSTDIRRSCGRARRHVRGRNGSNKNHLEWVWPYRDLPLLSVPCSWLSPRFTPKLITCAFGEKMMCAQAQVWRTTSTCCSPAVDAALHVPTSPKMPSVALYDVELTLFCGFESYSAHQSFKHLQALHLLAWVHLGPITQRWFSEPASSLASQPVRIGPSSR
jgi:hypothetical protein